MPSYLGTGVGTSEKNTRSGAGEGSSLTGVAKAAEGGDSTLGCALLRETSLGNGQKCGDEECLRHVVG